MVLSVVLAFLLVFAAHGDEIISYSSFDENPCNDGWTCDDGDFGEDDGVFRMRGEEAHAQYHDGIDSMGQLIVWGKFEAEDDVESIAFHVSTSASWPVTSSRTISAAWDGTGFYFDHEQLDCEETDQVEFELVISEDVATLEAWTGDSYCSATHFGGWVYIASFQDEAYVYLETSTQGSSWARWHELYVSLHDDSDETIDKVYAQDGDNCDSHDDCPSDKYCDTATNCWFCQGCSFYDDPIDGTCPSKCSGDDYGDDYWDEHDDDDDDRDDLDDGNGCDGHDDCASTQYCDAASNCWDCSECAKYDDPIDGTCPTKCDEADDFESSFPSSPTRKPTYTPTRRPTGEPTREPTYLPTRRPTRAPTDRPTSAPSQKPSKRPTYSPTTTRPIRQPTREPTRPPTPSPARSSTRSPTPHPRARPAREPTYDPTRLACGQVRANNRFAQVVLHTAPDAAAKSGADSTPITKADEVRSGSSRNRASSTRSHRGPTARRPSGGPSLPPTRHPSPSPTRQPSLAPRPALKPTTGPTSRASRGPTPVPAQHPVRSPTVDPSLEPTTTTTSGCFDSSSWFGTGDTTKDCDWVARRPWNRCGTRNSDDTYAYERCRLACGCSAPPVFAPSTMPSRRATLRPSSSGPQSLQPSSVAPTQIGGEGAGTHATAVPTRRQPPPPVPQPTMVPDASLIIVVASAAIVFANSTASEFGAEEEAAFAASIALALGVSVSQVAEISTQELSFGDDDDISVSFAVFYETSADSELLLLEEVKSTLKEAVINGTFEGADVEASLRAIDEAVVVYLAPPTNRPSTSRPSARAHAGGTGTSSDNSAVVAIIVVTVSLAVLLGAVVFMLQATKHWLPWSCLKKNKSGTLAAPRDSNYDIRPAATNSFAAVEQEEEEDEIGLVAIVDEERRPPKAPHESYAMRARNRRIDWSTATVRFAATSERTYVRQFAVGSMTLTLARGPVGRLHPPESDSFQTTSEKLRHDLEHATTFDARVAAFQRETKRLHTPWQHGRVEFAVRRGSEAEDAYEKLKELEAADWRKRWFAGFAGEEALDAGGCSREFFHALSTQLFDVAFGLFKYGSGYSYQLADDAHSASVFPEDWEQWYEFVGRVVAKALLEGHVLPAHPSTILLKHMAGEPLKLDDLQTLDHDLWHSLDSLKRMTPEEIEGLELTFAVQQTVSAGASEKELVPGGTNKPVTSANLDQFIELRLKERVLDVCQRGLNACLEGLYSVLPLEVLMLLSAHELELTLCGIPELDVSKWKQSTNYRGAFEEAGADHQVVKWFWAVLEDWDHKKRASLLQWCTGTSALPVQGFGSLQGRDGEIRKFTLTSVALSQACYPRSHTCFNRIDLPLYKSKAELATALDFVLNPELATAFSMD